MEAPLEEIEFLARSQNRVAVLRLLATESHTRRSLAAATGASQATLGRILRTSPTDRGSDATSPSSVAAVADGRTPASRSGTSPTGVDTTGRLQASASFTALGDPSCADVSSSASAAFMYAGIRSWGTPVTTLSAISPLILSATEPTMRSARGKFLTGRAVSYGYNTCSRPSSHRARVARAGDRAVGTARCRRRAE